MTNKLLPALAVVIMLLSGSAQILKAQDTIKKTVVKKPAVTKVTTTVIKPGVPGAIPINPKTGKPYTKWGYGAYAKNKYDATAAARKADSLKKAAALKAATPVKATPVVKTTPAPVVAAPVAVAAVVPKVDSAANVANSKSLNGQYQYLLTKVYNYQQPFVAAIWKNFIDTLNAGRRKLVDAEAKVAQQNQTIAGLQADAKTKEDSTLKADEISFLGMAMSKDAYNIIMWGLVIIFGAIAAFVIFRTGSLKREAVYRTNLHSELEEEFKAYKAKAADKEKKLARELQTERNKVDELMGK